MQPSSLSVLSFALERDGDRPPPERAGASPRSAALRCVMAQEIVSTFLDIPISEILQPQRSVAGICQARHIAVYLAHVAFQVPLSLIAPSFGRDRSSIAHAVRRIEDQREDMGFDAFLCRLERLSTSCAELMPPLHPAQPEGSAQ